jgi:hypothetical protein
MGRTKVRELAKVARREQQGFDCAPWVHKALELPREEFKREVERYLTGKETEPWEILYFEAYKRQLPVIERVLPRVPRQSPLRVWAPVSEEQVCGQVPTSNQTFPASYRLLVPQRDHGVDAHRSPRGDRAGQQCDKH